MTSSHSFFNSNRRAYGTSQSETSPDIIDLTGSPPQTATPTLIHSRSRPTQPDRQNFPPAREIIDVDALPDAPAQPPPAPPPRQWISQTARRHVPYLPSEDPSRNHDVVILGDSPPTEQRSLPSLFNIIRSSFLGNSSNTEQVTHFHYHIHQPSSATPFRPPGHLNYAMNAAHIYADSTPLRDTPGFKDESYIPPPPPRSGFTRSPTEQTALICPQCNDELGKGHESPKKDVWIGKCGHTYCGECAASHRSNKSKGARAGRCIVEGCTKIVSGDKGMIKVIL
jgi:hypothetical protein